MGDALLAFGPMVRRPRPSISIARNRCGTSISARSVTGNRRATAFGFLDVAPTNSERPHRRQLDSTEVDTIHGKIPSKSALSEPLFRLGLAEADLGALPADLIAARVP